MEWMILPLKRYFDFRGRSRRKEFWMWVLFVIIVSVILGIVDAILGLGGQTSVDNGAMPNGMGYAYGAGVSGGWLANIFSLVILIPNLAVSVRRLHDINRTGWWLAVPIVLYLIGIAMIVMAFVNGSMGAGLAGAPGVGMIAMLLGFLAAIVLLIFYCIEGTTGPNWFGPDPKDPHGAMDVEDVFR